MEIFRIEHGQYLHGPYNTAHWDSKSICDCGYFPAMEKWNEDMNREFPWHDDDCFLMQLRSVTEAMLSEHCDIAHPPPQRDNLFDIAPDEVCAFLDLADLHEWFAGFQDTLAEVGYRISVFEVDECDIRVGDTQIVFRNGERLTTLPLTGKVAA